VYKVDIHGCYIRSRKRALVSPSRWSRTPALRLPIFTNFCLLPWRILRHLLRLLPIGGSRGICCGSCSSTGCGFACCSCTIRGGSALSLISWSIFIWPTPASGSLDFNICIGCCLSGASSADGLDAQRASACEASTFIRSCRIISCCCSVMVGGSKRVCRSHCIHDAAACQSSADSKWGRIPTGHFDVAIVRAPAILGYPAITECM
jgi:hypothetical protein